MENDIMVPSIWYGGGLALDLFLLTIANFKNDKMSFLNWTWPLVLTHTIFPTLSIIPLQYFDEGSDEYINIKMSLGLIGFIFIFWFLYLEFKEIINHHKSHDAPDSFQLSAILAVSWDALLCGPAFASLTESWSNTEIIFSVTIFGLIVLIFSTSALFIAKQLRKIKFKNESQLERVEFIGDWLKFSVIGSFGFLSLWHTFGDGDFYFSLLFSLFFFGVIFYLIRDFILKPS